MIPASSKNKEAAYLFLQWYTSKETQKKRALIEDIGSGDLTAELVPEHATDTATIVAREPGVLCGIDWVNEVFRQVDPTIRLDWKAADGEALEPEQVICELSGKSRGHRDLF